jgi:hypothetical protein
LGVRLEAEITNTEDDNPPVTRNVKAQLEKSVLL